MNHATLLTLIHSGQLTDQQVAAEMRDPSFAAYWREHAERTHPTLGLALAVGVSAACWAALAGVVA